LVSRLDDYLVHQIAEPVAYPATSDRNFYDRYYFGCHDTEGKLFLMLAFGQYPNLGVTDAFVSVVYEGKQHVVRASRELGLDRMDTHIGPLGVEVVEPTRRLRIYCEPNEWGLEYDITFEARVEGYLEPRFYRRSAGRVTQDYVRTTQTGRYSGWIKVAGRRIELTADRYWGQRDHSWGIRGIGDPDPSLVRPPAPGMVGTFFWNWACMQFPDHTLLYTVSEEADGTRWNDSSVRLPGLAGGGEVQHYQSHHNLEFISGSRQFKRASIELTAKDGAVTKVDCEPLMVLWMSGCGYGGDWRHGQYHGPLAVEGMTYDLSNADDLRKLAGIHETVCRFSADGEVGYGIFEMLVAGVYPRYGFNTPRDVAP
jgi:hypothetical protein